MSRMNQKLRDRLLEAIMEKITPIVEQYITEYGYDESDDYDYDESTMFSYNIMKLNDELDEIKNQVNKKLRTITKKEADSLCLDCAANAKILRTMLPVGRMNEIFNSTEEFKKSFKEFQQRLKGIFNLADWQVEVADVFRNGNALARTTYPVNRRIYTVIIPQLNKNIPHLIDFMDKNGYYYIRSFVGEDVESLEDSNSKVIPMAVILFAQKKPADIKEWAKQYPYLYHVTSFRNMDYINKFGLIPQERKSDYDVRDYSIHYPERTYFYCGTDESEAIEYAKRDMMGGRYQLLRIKVEDLLENVPIYSDPLLGGNAVYIEEKIAPELIENVKTFDIGPWTTKL